MQALYLSAGFGDFGGYRDGFGGRGGRSDGAFFGVDRKLNAEERVKRGMIIEVCPEGYIDGLCSDITLNS